MLGFALWLAAPILGAAQLLCDRGDLARLAIGLLENAMPLPKAVRLLGVSLSSLQGENDTDPQLYFSI